MTHEAFEQAAKTLASLTKEEPLEWDANSTEGDEVDPQPLPDFEPALFTEVPGVEVIDAH